MMVLNKSKKTLMTKSSFSFHLLQKGRIENIEYNTVFIFNVK